MIELLRDAKRQKKVQEISNSEVLFSLLETFPSSVARTMRKFSKSKKQNN